MNNYFIFEQLFSPTPLLQTVVKNTKTGVNTYPSTKTNLLPKTHLASSMPTNSYSEEVRLVFSPYDALLPVERVRKNTEITPQILANSYSEEVGLAFFPYDALLPVERVRKNAEITPQILANSYSEEVRLAFSPYDALLPVERVRKNAEIIPQNKN